MEFGTDLREGWVISQYNPINLLETIFTTIITRFSFEKVELIEFLLGHNEVLSGNDRQILLILTFLDGQDLIWLPLYTLHELNGNLVQLLKSAGVVDPQLVKPS